MGEKTNTDYFDELFMQEKSSGKNYMADQL
jgi:hypothetical protein